MITMKLRGFDDVRAMIQQAPREVIEAADKELKKGAIMVADDMIHTITSGGRSGRMYGKHQASAPGEPPANWSGKLVASIRWLTRGVLNYYVEASAEHAHPLEFGTHKMAARPFMLPTMEKNEPIILANMKRAIQAALEKLSRRGKQ